jgi:hypothetical protein
MWQKILSVLGLVVVLVAMAIGGTFGKLIGKSAFGPSKPTPQQMEQALSEGLQKGAQQINARGPTMVDKDTRMDSASAGPGARMTYHYTFLETSTQIGSEPTCFQRSERACVKTKIWPRL